MAARAIIRMGDSTSHGGRVIEGYSTAIIMGKPIAGVGHKVSCPKCKGVFPIVEGVFNFMILGRSVAVEGMKTSCGAILIASQESSIINIGSGSHSFPAGSSALFSQQDEIIEQYYELVDSVGNPIDGYRYDLFSNSEPVQKSGDLSTGKTILEKGSSSLQLVVWLNKAGEIKS